MPASRDELALEYLEQLPFTPYPAQEEAIYAWFNSQQGVLVCAPTGTGKTLIAEAAAYEALRTGSRIYYTTPLIALTDQKFHEMQAAAARWGFHPDDVGLVTGNRRVNPEAKVLVVVAEILLNRLLQPAAFDFSDVSAVVMDEFHSFADAERGIVWEFTLGLLPAHVRLLLLSATVGNAVEFLSWLDRGQNRRLELVQSTERKVPLSFQWVADKLLNEQLEEMAAGDADARRTPALVFCFNREECWAVAEELKGKAMLAEGQQKQLVAQLEQHNWSKGAGPKLKQILMRGVGVHHAGLLPKHRRVVEELFQKKLLSVCVCTETLSAGINLPARSVVVPCLLKGPPDQKKLIDASGAHQMFGRAGRPQFDSQGYVYALPHEDDVRILRWKEKYDQIPEDTKDPGLLKAKKALKKKQPTRSQNRQYWNQSQFDKLRTSPPKSLSSQGPLPWRMLGYMLQLSPDVEPVRQLVHRRLMDPKRLDDEERTLYRMLRSLHTAGVVRLEPEPPAPGAEKKDESPAGEDSPDAAAKRPEPPKPSTMQRLLLDALRQQHEATGRGPVPVEAAPPKAPEYRPLRAVPTDKLSAFFVFRSVNPLYAMFLLDHFHRADAAERMQAFESVLELPKSLLRQVRVPPPDRMPPGPLARDFLDGELVTRGLIAAADLYPVWDPDIPFEERKYAPPLGEKLHMLFQSEYPGTHGLFVQPVWAAGELLDFGGDFYQYVTSKDLSKQEGLVFRHLLRLVLLLGEFSQVTPPGMDGDAWREELRDLAEKFTASCRAVDPTSTEYALSHAADADFVAQVATGGKTGAAPGGAIVASGGAPLPQNLSAPAADPRDGGGEPKEQPAAAEESDALADDFGAGLLEE